MNISSRGEYGIQALVDLGLHRDSGPTKIKSIAERQEIPKKYLEQVLLALKKGGVVSSTRGKKGGYVLADPPQDISIAEVLDALGEMDTLVDDTRDRPGYLSEFWDEKILEIRDALDVSLQSILERRRDSQKEMMYHI